MPPDGPASAARSTGSMPPGFRPPGRAHTPGTGTAPDRAVLGAMKAAIAVRFEPEDWAASRAYRYGAFLCAHGFYWEAHEMWEAVWMTMRPNSAEHELLRGLIQLANAGLKVRMRRPDAAARLLREAADRLAESRLRAGRTCFLGLDVAATEAEVRATARHVAAAQPAELSCIFLQLRPLWV